MSRYDIEMAAAMTKAHRDKEFENHLTGKDVMDAKEYDEWVKKTGYKSVRHITTDEEWKAEKKEIEEYTRQFLADAEDARHDTEKEVPRLAIELSDADVEQMYQEYLHERMGKVSKKQGEEHE